MNSFLANYYHAHSVHLVQVLDVLPGFRGFPRFFPPFPKFGFLRTSQSGVHKSWQGPRLTNQPSNSTPRSLHHRPLPYSCRQINSLAIVRLCESSFRDGPSIPICQCFEPHATRFLQVSQIDPITCHASSPC